MTNSLLLPARFKFWGWVILIPATVLGIILVATEYEGLAIQAPVFAFFHDEFLSEAKNFSFFETNITNTLVGVLFIAGALLVGFSREKNEDEYIANLRLSSLLWAVLVNSLLLIFAFIFIYGTAFLNVMVYNMFTVLIIFIGRFNYVLFRNNRTGEDEK